MKNLLRVCFLICGLSITFISCSPPAEVLTREDVMSFVTDMERATSRKDVTGVSDALSDDVIIVLNIDTRGQKQILQPSKREYVAMLEKSWSVVENYKYSRSNLEIDFKGHKAIVTADITESMTIKGRRISSESHEVVTIEMINARPLATKVVGHITM
jgi:hypothetical protein